MWLPQVRSACLIRTLGFGLSAVAILFSQVVNASECLKHLSLENGNAFSIRKENTTIIRFAVGKTVGEAIGDISPKERTDLENDRKLWEALSEIVTGNKSTLKDVAFYPAVGVDFGLPITVYAGAQSYVGVDPMAAFSQRIVRRWSRDPSFDVASLFQKRRYIRTVPYMVNGDAGKGISFVFGFLRNLVLVLPKEAVIDSVEFILDLDPVASSGPHTAVKWHFKGEAKQAILIADRMPSFEERSKRWWIEELLRVQPRFVVMKRPQGFSFDEVFGSMCEWVVARGGQILSEGNHEDNTATGRPAEVLRKSIFVRHEIHAKALNIMPPIFGFDDTAVLVEVLPPRATR